MGAVFRDAWRRFSANQVFWGLPLLLALGFVLTVLFLASMFVSLRLTGLFLVFLGMWAYGAMALAAFTGVWAAAARTGRATIDDASRGIARFFWRMAGYIGVLGLVSVVVGTAVNLMVLGQPVLPVSPGGPDPSLVRVTTGAVWQIVGLVRSFALILFFAFAPAAVALEGCGLGDGFVRGLRFVGRRLGPVAALAAVAVVLWHGPGFALTWPFAQEFQTLATEMGAGFEAELMALASRMLPVMVFLAVYVYFIWVYIMLSFFIAYERWRDAAEPACAGGTVRE
ncbi:MAG TPA: hypothetical protein DHW14_05100 [Clostridiales bacterium]|nr:hypothetical protein [Clostridiales bacterium]